MPSTLGIVASGEDVLNDAVFWVDAGRSSVSSGALTNLGTGGSALNAVFGNTTGVDTFDPALLAHTGTNYLYLPGVAGNYAQVPNAAPLQVTGDIEIVVRASSTDWSPAAGRTLIAKRVTAGQHCWQLANASPNGNLTLGLFLDGTTFTGVSATVNNPFVDGVTYWIKVTRNATTGAVNFYYAADQPTEPTVWTQLGAQVNATAGALFAGTDAVQIGTNRTGVEPHDGGLYRAIVRNGIGGTTVFDADFTTGITSGGQTTFTESSANAATVTINRATSGRKSVAVVRPVLLFGTDDYLEIADNDLLDFGASQDMTLLWVGRQWGNTAGAFRAMLAKMSNLGAAPGWAIMSTAGEGLVQFRTRDASTQVVPTFLSITAGANAAAFAVRQGTSHRLTVSNNGTSSTNTTVATALDTTNTTVVRIGANVTGGQVWEGELVAAAVWRRALNANEIATIVNRYT